MDNLEEKVDKSFFGKVKAGLNRIRYSTINKITVYSLAGILGAGLGYGCGGAQTTASEKDVSEIHRTEICEQACWEDLPEIYLSDSKQDVPIYQINPYYCETDDDCVCRCLDEWGCDCHCYNKDAPEYESPEPPFACGAPFCIEDTVLCFCEENTCLEKDVTEIDGVFSAEVCQKVCTKIGYWKGGCLWPEESEQLELPILNLGPCFIPESKHCGEGGQCNCYCYSE